jgi:WD repeat-containing protein 44
MGQHTQSNHMPPQMEIPGYVRIRSHNISNSQFRNLFLAQELVGGKQPEPGYAGSAPQTAIGSKMSSGGDATIWAAEFSPSGRYLAVAGKDRSIKLFKVISTEEERLAQQRCENGTILGSKSLSAPVFLSRPYREFKGHSAEILTLSWSKNDFLLSGSTDKTVRLWHPSQPTCLRVFQHDRTVTSVAFHPTDDRFFLSGSFDAILRLWDITRTSIIHSSPMAGIITAVAFSPDGKVAICGSFDGICIFLNTTRLTERSRICIQSFGSNSRVSFKITGLQTMVSSDSIDPTRQAKLMITTNDSRVRIYNLADHGLEHKLEGIRSQSSQIHARFNDSGEYAICGSEDDEVHIWHLNSREPKESHEKFHTHSEAVTTAGMAPTVTREILSLSQDPIYNLCDCGTSGRSELHGHKNHTANTSCITETTLDSSSKATMMMNDASYNGSSSHSSGHIIVTTDTMGKIKVYRRNCAFDKRYGMPHSYMVT